MSYELANLGEVEAEDVHMGAEASGKGKRGVSPMGEGRKAKMPRAPAGPSASNSSRPEGLEEG